MTTDADVELVDRNVGDGLRERIGHGYGEPPYHYTKGEEVTVLFETDSDILKALLPAPLELGRRATAVFRVMRHQRSIFGPYTGVYLGVIAQFGDQTVFHMLTGLKTDFAGTIAGRGIWGMPLQLGHVDMSWRGDILRIRVGRAADIPFAEVLLHLSDRTDGPKRSIESTFEVQRRGYDGAGQESLLVGLAAEGSSEGAEFWSATASLSITGNAPRDDWSVLPVRKILGATYSAGGTTTLNYGTIKARW